MATRDDAAYLAAALARAGRDAPDGPVTVEPLTGGRTGARVERLEAGGRHYVRKRVPQQSWRHAGFGLDGGGEPALWRHDVMRRLGPRVRWPVIDLATDGETGDDVLLMDDVSPGIRARGALSRADSHALFDAVADLHARFLGDAALDDAPLPPVGATLRLFTTPLLHLVGRRPSDQPWVTALLADFRVMGDLAPPFLELLGPARADDYLALCADEAWQRRLAAHPRTLLHGDLRRANVAFEPGGVALFDWERAAAGPPACDLQWHCLLQYWAYPSAGEAPGDPCDDLRDRYVAALEARVGPIDRVAFDDSWRLAWVGVIACLGYVLADGASRDVAVRAVERAVDALA